MLEKAETRPVRSIYGLKNAGYCAETFGLGSDNRSRSGGRCAHIARRAYVSVKDLKGGKEIYHKPPR